MIKSYLQLRRNHLKFFCMGLFFLGIQSCANSELAQKLSNSFDSSLETATTITSIDKKNSAELELTNEPQQRSQAPKKSYDTLGKKVGISQSGQSIPKKLKKTSPKAKAKEVSFSPQPYRIIIRLSGANPSAPAETVTKALRNAGILFEVERIERFEKGSSSIVKLDKR